MSVEQTSFSQYSQSESTKDNKQSYHKWDESEIQKLMDAVTLHGHKWILIQQTLFPYMQVQMVKNKYYATIKKEASVDEDQRRSRTSVSSRKSSVSDREERQKSVEKPRFFPPEQPILPSLSCQFAVKLEVIKEEPPKEEQPAPPYVAPEGVKNPFDIGEVMEFLDIDW